MSGKAAASSETFDCIYKEYVRLCEIADRLTTSTTDDFTLLGSAGAILAWKPIADNVLTEGENDQDLLFFGFLAALGVVVVIMCHNLQKRSLLEFYLREIAHYEDAIRSVVSRLPSTTFATTRRWSAWSQREHHVASAPFVVAYVVVIVVVPLILLAPSGGHTGAGATPTWWAVHWRQVLYGGISFAAASIYGMSRNVVELVQGRGEAWWLRGLRRVRSRMRRSA